MTVQSRGAGRSIEPVQLARPARMSQATAIEQSRAAAEVAAAVYSAQANPRSTARAVAAMEEACRQPHLAERAFFRFPRGGQNVTGITIHLARELARVWGNLDYGIGELDRHDGGDAAGMSEMRAWAWDLETNTRSTLTFMVPHARDTKEGRQPLTDLRDVYENNTNNGARRVRQCIVSILPAWFVERARQLCFETLQGQGGSEPLAKRVAGAIARYAADFNVVADQLEAKLGRAHQDWTEHDMATLHVIYTSLKRGETIVHEEFPPAAVSVDELKAATAPAPAAPPARGDQPPAGEPAEAAEPPAAAEPAPPAKRTRAAARPARTEQADTGELPIEDPPGDEADWPPAAQPPDAR